MNEVITSIRILASSSLLPVDLTKLPEPLILLEDDTLPVIPSVGVVESSFDCNSFTK